MLRANSRLHSMLGASGVDFLKHAVDAIQRVLPHVEVSHWTEAHWVAPSSVWTDQARREIRMTIAIGNKCNGRSLSASIRRRQVSVGGAAAGTLDTREHDICSRVADRISEVLKRAPNIEITDEFNASRSRFF